MDEFFFNPCKVIFFYGLGFFRVVGFLVVLEHSFVFFVELFECNLFFFVDFS
jgi:hypothetical protein